MLLRTITIKPNQGYKLHVAGKLFRLTYKSDPTAKLDLYFQNGSETDSPPVIDVPKGTRYAPPEGFASVRFLCDKACTIIVLISDGWADIDNDLSGTKVIIGNDCTSPIPITTCSGVPLDVSINQPNGCADAIHVDICPTRYKRHNCEQIKVSPLNGGGSVFVTGTGTSRIKRWMLRNIGNEPIAIEPDNGSGVATGYGVILLDPDEWWAETDNPDWTWIAYSQNDAVMCNLEILES